MTSPESSVSSGSGACAVTSWGRANGETGVEWWAGLGCEQPCGAVCVAGWSVCHKHGNGSELPHWGLVPCLALPSCHRYVERFFINLYTWHVFLPDWNDLQYHTFVQSKWRPSYVTIARLFRGRNQGVLHFKKTLHCYVIGMIPVCV